MKIDAVPDIITGANLAVGVIALTYAIDGRFALSAVLILAAAILDMFDGKIARMIGSSSQFGREFDSLADLVSFGVAPAVSVYLWQLHAFGGIGIAMAVLFVLFGAIRLARFNISQNNKYFTGVPITAAGAIMAGYILVGGGITAAVSAMLVIVLSILMVSGLKIPKI